MKINNCNQKTVRYQGGYDMLGIYLERSKTPSIQKWCRGYDTKQHLLESTFTAVGRVGHYVKAITPKSTPLGFYQWVERICLKSICIRLDLVSKKKPKKLKKQLQKKCNYKRKINTFPKRLGTN